MRQVVGHINNSLKETFLEIQEVSLFIARAARCLPRNRRHWHELLNYMDIVGVGSLPVVIIAGACFGAMLAMETLFQLQAYNAEVFLGRVTGVSIVRGAGPVITAMIVSSRVCPSAAAELGAMQTTQQIDAMLTMGISPFQKLITPRIIAGFLMYPALTVVNAITAILTGGLVAHVSKGGMRFTSFLHQSLSAVSSEDLLWGLTKSTVFGTVVISAACYYGMRITGGTAGVRKGATQAAVGGILLILILDFVLTTFIVRAF